MGSGWHTVIYLVDGKHSFLFLSFFFFLNRFIELDLFEIWLKDKWLKDKCEFYFLDALLF